MVVGKDKGLSPESMKAIAVAGWVFGEVEQTSGKKVMTMNTTRHPAPLILGLIVSMAVLACTSGREVGSGVSGQDTKEACFNVINVRSYSPLHERYVYVKVSSNEHYLLTLDHYCTGLPYTTGVKITGDFSRVCSESGAKITYMGSGRPAEGRIIRVEAVASREEAEQLVKQRTTPKPRN